MFSSLSSLARTFLEREYVLSDPPVSWTMAREAAHGDLSTSIALQSAKQAGRPPREIADALARHLLTSDDVVKAEVAGAGYVNVWLTPKALLKALKEAKKALKK